MPGLRLSEPCLSVVRDVYLCAGVDIVNDFSVSKAKVSLNGSLQKNRPIVSEPKDDGGF